MLNISNNSIKNFIDQPSYGAFRSVLSQTSGKKLSRFLTGALVSMLIILFLPWTQNIRSRGEVIALNPEERPQTIHSVIDGRIEKWFVQEGDFVKQGDTVLFISEVKEDYMDPDLLLRTDKQLKAKEMTVESYMNKITALDRQIDALTQTGQLKLEQAENKLRQAHLKVSGDSIEFETATINLKIAGEQLKRMEELHRQGLKSLTDLEKRRLTEQKAQSELINKEAKLLSSRNEVINAQIQLASIQADYRDKVAKAESEKFSALSNMYDAEATVTKLQNQYMNYSIRSGLYYITAPQDGFITKAIQTGIGETIKSGSEIVSIMPANHNPAVAMYVKPIDLPLIRKGTPVRMQFDGWPAIVFSGWPNVSTGTFPGKVFAIDNFMSAQGKYRVLVVPDEEGHEWPPQLRLGAGASSFALLQDVPVWYELWRQINGFPADFYPETESSTDKSSKKK